MTGIKRFFLLFHLLNKRIIKRYSFLVVLCLVPLLVAGMFLAAKEDSGILHIVLCREDSEDELSGQIIEELLAEKSVLRFTKEESLDTASLLLEQGEADAIWVFADNMQEIIRENTTGKNNIKPIVTVIEREENVFLHLARERLLGVLYSDMSYSLYRNYCLELLEGQDISEEKLWEEYQVLQVTGGIFSFERLGEDAVDVNTEHYLLAPLRGLLSLVILLCGFTASMYYQQDRADGIFTCMRVGNRRLFPYIYHGPAIFDASLVVMITLFFTGIWNGWQRELTAMFIYGLMCAAFCNLIRKILRSLQGLAAGVPILICVTLVICPVFISLRGFRMLQFLFPTFYYLQLVSGSAYLKHAVIYLMVIYGVDICLGKE